jgi:hypothetical protein
MTELDAVNDMLMSIGQAPVNTLEVSGITDVSIARQRLDVALRNTLARGWWFNTDTGYELSPDVDSIVLVPANALKVEGAAADVTERTHPTKGRALYNRAERAFEFDDAVSCEIVWGFGFADIPQTARTYVATVAARRFQSKAIGSQILDRFEEEDELKAWVNLIREDRASRRTNLFTGNRGVSSFGDRSY